MSVDYLADHLTNPHDNPPGCSQMHPEERQTIRICIEMERGDKTMYRDGEEKSDNVYIWRGNQTTYKDGEKKSDNAKRWREEIRRCI